MDIYRIEGCLRYLISSPDILIERFPREDGTLMIHESFEESIFEWRKLYSLSLFEYHFCISIDTDIADICMRILMRRYGRSILVSFDNVLDPETELLEVKGLHEIVISAECESLDLICLFPESGEKEKWYLDRASSKHPYERESIDLWHHPIEDEKVVFLSHDHIEGDFPILRTLDLMSLCFEVESDIFSDGRMIFDDDDTHRYIFIHYNSIT
jgi:hypothetical protein